MKCCNKQCVDYFEEENNNCMMFDDLKKCDDFKSKEITITLEEYQDLIHANQVLKAFYSCGIDTWEGHEAALSLVNY